MAPPKTSIIDAKLATTIRQLIPLASLPIAHFNALCAKLQIITLEPGALLFKAGDQNPDLIFVLDGKVSLQAQGMQIEIFNPGSSSGRFALAHQIPRKIDAQALTKVHLIRVKLDDLITHKNDTIQEHVEVMNIDQPSAFSDDWMTTLLKSAIFKRLPPANLQKFLTALDEVHHPKGALIIKQGDIGEHFYLVKKGHCAISRRPTPQAREIILAQLRKGDMFGEDALLSDQPISASVTALTPVVLMRLGKTQFLNLVKEATIKYVSPKDLDDEVATGAVVLDVRLQDAFELKHLPHSVNTPFFTLRMQLQLGALDRSKSVIVVCEDGKISHAAAFLLLRHKIAAKVLKDGLNGIAKNEALNEKFVFEQGPSEFNPLVIEQPAFITDYSSVSVAKESSHMQDELLRMRRLYDQALQEKQALEEDYQSLIKQNQQLQKELQNAQKHNFLDPLP